MIEDFPAYCIATIPRHVHFLVYKELRYHLRLVLEHDFLLDFKFEAL